ncbi:MAG: selenium metabolism hydrolase [Candidatus Cloacimonetes bacterium 4572_55]|nr:MAG: selenium metabolism hydrolase [Candidatus Cloacimonetes bacterium 4572_55]
MNHILKLAHELQNDLANFLSDLVRIPSVSGDERAVIQRIKQETARIGYDKVYIDSYGNLLGRIGEGRRVIVFDGHCDIVDVGNPDMWNRDPFSGAIENGMLYGRGSCDQKGGLASAIYAAKILKKIGVPEDVTVWVIASIQEEDLEGAAWHYILHEDNLLPETVVITEPTNLNIYRGHRGRIEIKVETSGVSCHGSAPERGVNAIYKMSPIIQEIKELNDRLAFDDFLGKGTVTISDIRSSSPSLCAVADQCVVHLDRRLTIGETIFVCLNEIEQLPSVKKAKAEVYVNRYEKISYTGMEYPMDAYCPSWVLPKDHPLLDYTISCYQNLFGCDPDVGKWTFSTNGVGTMGTRGIPTVGFGPGNEIYAHAPNEFIPIEHLVKACAFYAEFVRKY